MFAGSHIHLKLHLSANHSDRSYSSFIVMIVRHAQRKKRECGRARHKLRSEGMRLWITRTGPVDAMPVVRTRKPRETCGLSRVTEGFLSPLRSPYFFLYLSCFVFSPLILSLSPLPSPFSLFILKRFVRHWNFLTKIFFDLIAYYYIFFKWLNLKVYMKEKREREIQYLYQRYHK